MKRSILLIALLLNSCASYNGISGVPYPNSSNNNSNNPNQSFDGSGSLSQLIPNSIASDQERDLRAFKRRSIAFKFPVKIGIVFVKHQSSFKAHEKQEAFEKMKSKLENAENQSLVRELIEIPSSLVRDGQNTDAIRKLGSQFQLDIVAILNGEQNFEKASEQKLNFFDLFSNKRAYESRSSLESILLNVFSGTFLSSLQGAGQAGPEILDPEDISFNGGKHKLEIEAEMKAWDKMTINIENSLISTRNELLRNPEPELDLNGNPIEKNQSETN